MKKFFSILLVLSFAFVYAHDEQPVFEETGDEECQVRVVIPFAAEEPVLEEENANCEEDEYNEDECVENECTAYENECEEDECSNEDSSEKNYSAQRLATCRFEKKPPSASYLHWKRYKVNFGMEKILLRFPTKPTISQSSTILTAFAYDHTVMYSFTGYYPPMGNVAPNAWFDEILYSISQYPFSCLSHAIYQVSSGDWVLDYVAHDFTQNLIIKTRAVVTPFNAYTIQCVKPNGIRDDFDYFLDNFWIKCDCDH